MLCFCWFVSSGILLVSGSGNVTKSAEVGLESVLGLNNTDHFDNIKFLNKVEKVITNIKSIFETDEHEKLETFDDFIQSLFKILNKFEDRDLYHFVKTFNHEIRNYHYKGCKFHSLIENYSLRTYLSNVLNSLHTLSADTIRSKLTTALNKLKTETFQKHERNLLEFINIVYGQNSMKILENFLVKLENYRLSTSKMNEDLTKIIKEGIRSIIFDYYSRLNDNMRNALNDQVNEFWVIFTKTRMRSTISSNQNVKNSNNVKNKLTMKPIEPEIDDSHNVHINKEIEVEKQYDHLSDISKAKSEEYEEINKNSPSTKRSGTYTKLDDHSKATTEARKISKDDASSNKQPTFTTLYPDSEIEKSSVIPDPSRRLMASRVRHQRIRERGSHGVGRIRGRRVVKKSGPRWKDSAIRPYASRLKTKAKQKVPLRRHPLRRIKRVRASTTHKTKQRKQLRPLRNSKSLRRSRPGEFENRPQKKQYRSYKSDLMSEEGLSIEKLPFQHYRRTDTNDTLPSNLSKTVTESSLGSLKNNVNLYTTIVDTTKTKDKLYYNDTLNFRLGHSTYEIKRATEKYFTDSTGNNTFKVDAQPLNSFLPTEIVSNHEENKLNNMTIGNKPQVRETFNFRATDINNETEIESTKHETNNTATENTAKLPGIKNKTSVKEFENPEGTERSEKDLKVSESNKNDPNIEAEDKSIDFQTYIDDYGKDFDVLNSNKDITGADKHRVTTVSNKKNFTPRTLMSSYSSSTSSPLTSPPVITSIPLRRIPPITTSLSQIPYQTSEPNSFFNAQQIKQLMRTTEGPATVKPDAMGRYFSYDGVMIDSIEQLKEEVADMTNIDNVSYEDD